MTFEFTDFEKMFLSQLLFDIKSDPEARQIAQANGPAAFREWLASKFDGYVAARFLRNEQLIEQMRADKDLRQQLFDDVREDLAPAPQQPVDIDPGWTPALNFADQIAPSNPLLAAAMVNGIRQLSTPTEPSGEEGDIIPF